MGKTIRVASFSDMSKASTTLQQLSQTYTQIYQQLMQEASTMGKAWEAADNLAFVEQITGFAEELETMAKKLLLASQTLDKQRANYVAHQDDNIGQAKKLTN